MIKLSNPTEYQDFNFSWPAGGSGSPIAILSLNHNKNKRPDHIVVYVIEDGQYYAHPNFLEISGTRYGWDRYHNDTGDENSETVRIYRNLSGLLGNAYARLFWFSSKDPIQADS